MSSLSRGGGDNIIMVKEFGFGGVVAGFVWKSLKSFFFFGGGAKIPPQRRNVMSCAVTAEKKVASNLSVFLQRNTTKVRRN